MDGSICFGGAIALVVLQDHAIPLHSQRQVAVLAALQLIPAPDAGLVG